MRAAWLAAQARLRACRRSPRRLVRITWVSVSRATCSCDHRCRLACRRSARDDGLVSVHAAVTPASVASTCRWIRDGRRDDGRTDAIADADDADAAAASAGSDEVADDPEDGAVGDGWSLTSTRQVELRRAQAERRACRASRRWAWSAPSAGDAVSQACAAAAEASAQAARLRADRSARVNVLACSLTTTAPVPARGPRAAGGRPRELAAAAAGSGMRAAGGAAARIARRTP